MILLGAFFSGPPALIVQDLVRSTAEERWSLFGVAFADPWFLTLIPLAIFLTWRGSEARRVAEARVPTIGDPKLAGSASSKLVWLAPIVRMLSVLLVIVGLSRPLEGRVSTSQETEGIDIALLLDRSSSMDQRERAGGPRRFDMVKDVVADFAKRRMTDEENARDNVALFGFARYAELLVPFTLDSDALQGVLSTLDVETEQLLDGTAIGGGLMEAVDVLRGSEAESRVAILLTDGEETAHEIEPMKAAKAAVEARVRVYTVFAGPREILTRTMFGDVRRRRAEVGDLPAIAEMTGGRFFHAESQEELEDAYEAIETLERTPRKEERFAERYDLYPFLIAPALLLYLLSWILGATVGRRLP
ncbi:von Willebrand factor type A domain protein [Planctomycetes bacterium Poly30]|uniref:von Willebrand factor type A domain protein n=1 Tax=Saltatorellus ferox TaxID=2528018 RepID=A0A518EWN8_9BACT|nr:von Willebrand factor type A domain protein [Planctomycetes bacterium Poly30]